MAAIIANFTSTMTQLAGSATLLLTALAIALIGALAGGRARLPEADLIFGWAVVSLVFTVVGAAGPVPFTYLAYGLAAAGAGAAIVVWRRDNSLGASAVLRTMILAAPLIALVGAMMPSQWDEFTQWLPNARYLFEHDTFPRIGLPKSPSAFPGYPYGLSIVIYMTSRLAGFLVENAGALFNLLLLLGFGVMIARLIRAVVTSDEGRAGLAIAQGGRAVPMGWGWCALGALAVTVFNPTFVTKIVFSAYSDSGTAVLMGAATILGWLMLDALAAQDDARARALAWQTGLVLTAMLNLRQVNLVLFVILLVAVVLVAWRDSRIPVRMLFRLLPRLMGLPLVVYLAWRLHLAGQMPAGDFPLMPLSEWHLALIPDILARMALIASKKGGYFGLMTVAVFFGVRGLVRMRGEFDRLAVLTAAIFLAYNAFLLFSYVAAFDDYDALRAASYWRYNMHVGGVAVAFAAYGLALLWRRHAARRVRLRLGGVAVALMVAMPFALSNKVRFDNDPTKLYVRAVGNDIARLVKPVARMVTIDVAHDGQYLVILRYAVYPSARIVREFTAAGNPTAETMRSIIAELQATHVWIHVPTNEVAAAFGLRLAPGTSYLLARRDGSWRIARSWPYPGQPSP